MLDFQCCCRRLFRLAAEFLAFVWHQDPHPFLFLSFPSAFSPTFRIAFRRPPTIISPAELNFLNIPFSIKLTSLGAIQPKIEQVKKISLLGHSRTVLSWLRLYAAAAEKEKKASAAADPPVTSIVGHGEFLGPLDICRCYSPRPPSYL